MHNHQFLKHWS